MAVLAPQAFLFQFTGEPTLAVSNDPLRLRLSWSTGAVGVVAALRSEGQSEKVKAETAADYEKSRALHANKKGVTLVSLEAAGANAVHTDWTAAPVAACSTTARPATRPRTGRWSACLTSALPSTRCRASGWRCRS